MKYPEKESSALEFKREIPKNNQIVKTIVGFCNQNGGKIIIGVEDDGTICGLGEDVVEKAREYLEKHVFETTCPPIIPLVYTQTIDAMIILIIQVARGMNKPYYVKGEGLERGVYIRLGRTTVRATSDIVEELRWSSRGLSFDTMPVYHARTTDIDAEKVKLFLKARRGATFLPSLETETLDLELLTSYNLVVTEHGTLYPTVAGILLFGKNPNFFFPEAYSICSRFSGIQGREAVAAKDCVGTLFEQFHQAYAFVVSMLTYSFTIKGIKRIEELEIPEIALREALVNALLHRNYHIKASMRVAIFDNRIEIYSPGAFPGPLSTKNLKMGITYIRNTALAKVFREAGYSEKLGTGFITIFSSYAARGLPEPEVIEGENFIKCILPRPSRGVQSFSFPDNDIQRILELFEVATDVSIRDIIATLHIPRATAGRKLALLVEQGTLKKQGKGAATRYSKA